MLNHLRSWLHRRCVGGSLNHTENLFIGPGIHGKELIVWININDVLAESTVKILKNPSKDILETRDIDDLTHHTGWGTAALSQLGTDVLASVHDYLEEQGY